MTISQTAVFDEVAQTTNYAGAKKDDDANAYERVATVDEDKAELLRFWNESRAEVAQAFIRLMESEGMNGDTYELFLNVSCSFDKALLPSMELGLFSYFVQSITSKWYVYTNKAEAAGTGDRGVVFLDEVKQKAFYKKKPERPTFG